MAGFSSRIATRRVPFEPAYDVRTTKPPGSFRSNVKFQACTYGFRISGTYRNCELKAGKNAFAGGFRSDGNGLIAPAYGLVMLFAALPLVDSTVPKGARSAWLFQEIVFGVSKKIP